MEKGNIDGISFNGILDNSFYYYLNNSNKNSLSTKKVPIQIELGTFLKIITID